MNEKLAPIWMALVRIADALEEGNATSDQQHADNEQMLTVMAENIAVQQAQLEMSRRRVEQDELHNRLHMEGKAHQGLLS